MPRHHADPTPDQWRCFLKSCSDAASERRTLSASGSLTRVTGLIMEAVGLRLAVGSGCTVLMPNGNRVEAEVVGFHGDRLYLMPANDVRGRRQVPRSFPGTTPGHPVPGDPRQPRRRASTGSGHSRGRRPAGPGGGRRRAPIGRARRR